MTVAYNDTIRNDKMDANTRFAGNAALLRIYTGPKPAKGAAISTQTLLAAFTLGSPIAPASVGGVWSPTLPANTNAVATGTAVWYRVVKSDGTTFCWDGDCAAGDLVLNTNNITSGLQLSMTSWSQTNGNG
jgi:hypothetical protein